jgi:FixJ family two-component response regulator
MAVSTSIGFVVDDNISVRQSLEFLIRNEGRQPEAFASAQVFLDRHESPLQAFSFLTFLF